MRKIRSVLCLLLALVFLLSACQKSDSISSEGGGTKLQKEMEVFDPDSYTNAMMLEDYDFFWTTLEENCAPLENIQQARHVDLHQLKEEFRARVEAIPDGEGETFFRIMEELSGKFQNFAHIQIVDSIVYHRYLDGGTWESDTQKELFSAPLVQAFYNWADSLPGVEEELEQVQETETVEEDSDYASNILFSREGDTAIATVKTFLFYGEESLEQVIESLQNFCLENMDAQNFIIDITGNGGGNGAVWADGFAPLWAGKTFTHEVIAAYKSGEVNQQMWDGWPENDREVELREFSEITPEEFPQLDPAIRSSCAGIAIKTVTDDYSQEENSDGSRFEGRIWILTDKANASSAEDLVLFAKGNPFCTLVGTATGGGGGWMASPVNVDAAMPHCGMLFRFHPFYFINEDGASNDRNGTTPDIEIDSDETPMQRCLEEIQKLQK